MAALDHDPCDRRLVTEQASLLPPHSTRWELAQSLASANRRPLPADLPRRVWDPDRCPVDLLPYLAWGLGLEIWKDDWPEEKKRALIKRIWRLKRRKTTLQGIKDYVDLVGGEIVKAVRPKDRMWWVPAMSPQERAALDARLPEIRIFPRPPVKTADPEQTFFNVSFWQSGARYPERAMRAWLDRATFVQDGIEQRVTITGLDGNAVDSSYVIQLRASAVGKSFYGRSQFGGARIPSDAERHVITIAPNDGALTFSVSSGLIPIAVRPEPKAEIVAAPVYKAFHWPSFFNASCRTPSDALDHLYDSLRFMDPRKIGAHGRPMSFWVWSHSGIVAFSAELTLRTPIAKPLWQFWAFWGEGFWAATDLTPLWDALEAIRASQAARDDVSVSLQLFREVDFFGGLRFGEFSFGDYQKAA
jgi:phage tail P2-like protein